MDYYSPELITILEKKRPRAAAWIRGNESHPGLGGIVRFYPVLSGGILVSAELFGLPDHESANMGNDTQQSGSHFYAMHIHESGDCTPPFDKTGMHYNLDNVPHPGHAGDLPPLLSSDGYAWLAFFDGRLSIDEIIGRSIVIHAGRDDFTSQPAGNSGDKIGCGIIESVS